MSYRIGVDIGGTFADFCALDEATGRLATLKVLSTPQEPGREVIAGLAELGSRFGIQPQDIGYFTCQQHHPENFWNPAFQQHPNGVTGIAGPGSDGSGKPVGLTYIAVATTRGTAAHEYRFTGDRWSNRREAAAETLRLLAEEARLGVRLKTA